MSLRPLVGPIYVPTLVSQLSEQLTATSVAVFALEISGGPPLPGPGALGGHRRRPPCTDPSTAWRVAKSLTP